MEGLFTIDSLFTLLMLVLLQVVLGFDNLLYISLESRKAPVENQSHVRKLGVGLAIVLRIVLLFMFISSALLMLNAVYKWFGFLQPY